MKCLSVWTPDDWESMNSDLGIGVAVCKPMAAYSLGEEVVRIKKPQKVAVKKPVPTKEQKEKERIEIENARKLIEEELIRNYAKDHQLWFWRHLQNILLKLNITLDKIDDEQHYAANSDGQVCRVVYENDNDHPAVSANETARKIILFFAQQKLTEVKDEK
jgi:hypothetical protein